MSGAINFSGLSSGIDSSSIIQEILTIGRQPEKAYQAQQKNIQARQTAYNTVSGKLLGLQAAAYPLDALRAFNIVSADTGDNTVATVSAQTGAQTGTHAINITNLAQAQVIASAAQSSQTTPLNQHGQIIVNGKAINYQDADSLQTLAANINAAQAGVTASIITPTNGQYYLTLGSVNSGVQGKISLSDAGSGNLLGGALGLFAASSGFAQPLSGGVYGSALFADSATSVGTLEGQTSPAVGNVSLTISGTQQAITIDLSQSLSQIATTINNVAAGAAQVVTVTDPISNTNKQQLQLKNVTAFQDNNNVLANLGITQASLAANGELTQAKDAVFTIDNLPASRPTNSFTDAISGVTINLLKAGSTSLTVAPDTATIKSNILGFVKAYNDVLSSISSQSQYDPTTNNTGILFGDVTTQSIYDGLVSNVNGAIPGLPTNLTALSQIGITTDQTDSLQIDDSALSTALANNLSGVAKLFQSSGATSDPTVQFVSGTKDTVPSSSAGYAIHVFTPAGQAAYASSSIQTQPLATDETLTFAGALFGTSSTASPLLGPSLQLHAGATAADIVSQINADPIIGKQISASLAPPNGLDPGGELRLISRQYGSTASFAVVSTASIGINTSGIGATVQQLQGADIIATINGEAATGIGQFLTGSQTGGFSANGKALGLQLRVTATAPGDYGTVTYTSGVADLVKNYVTSQTDSYTGALTTAVNGLQDSYKDLQSNIDDIETRLTAEQQTLQQQFSAMELAIGKLKASSAGLAQIGSAFSSSTSSSSSSSG